MSRYSKQDAARDTGVSVKETSHAWHDARDDAAKDGGHGVPADRHGDGGDRSDTGSQSSSSGVKK